jgi:hypothetical protein
MPESLKLIVQTAANSRDMETNQEATVDNPFIQLLATDNIDDNPWDQAHNAITNNPGYTFTEPEVDCSTLRYAYSEETLEKAAEDTAASYFNFIDYWPHPVHPGIWHLGHDFSQLKKAKDFVANLTGKKTVRIAHLDTGYDKDHSSFPDSLIRFDLARNFVDGEEENFDNAEDQFNDGLLKMPGHGTGTLSILAGKKTAISEYQFDDYIGLYDSVEIVPIRLAKSVVLLKSGAFVKALDYIVNELYFDDTKRVHIVTMSMGGVASKAWAKLVNLAYERGIFIVSAAGNNFNKLPARTMIYPARFNRVVAACGVTYDFSPYAKPPGEGSFKIMEGNHGPASLMQTAIAAFTPNVPWASYKYDEIIGIRGDGTSSATPQVASAAALYYIKNYDVLEQLPEPWMRVEAIRHALFSTAKKEINDDNGRYDNDYTKYYGNGIVQAFDMLDVLVAAPNVLVKQEEDTVSFPFFKVILGIRALEEAEQKEDDMLETELAQLVIIDEKLQQLLQDEETTIEALSKEEQLQFADIVLSNEKASTRLKGRMQLLKNQLSL